MYRVAYVLMVYVLNILIIILFALYVNDLPLECKDVSLFLLMYAGDLALFSETVQGLQHMLDRVLGYSVEWGNGSKY